MSWETNDNKKEYYSIEEKLALVEYKQARILNEQYELELMQEDCVKSLKNRGNEFCYFVDLVDAWRKQPKKLTKPKTDFAKCQSQYEQLMYLLYKDLFNEDMNVSGALRVVGWTNVALTVPFTYKGHEFDLSIPNLDALSNFSEIKYAYYTLTWRKNKSLTETFAKFLTYDELKENLVSVLEREIREIECANGGAVTPV